MTTHTRTRVEGTHPTRSQRRLQNLNEEPPTGESLAIRSDNNNDGKYVNRSLDNHHQPILVQAGSSVVKKSGLGPNATYKQKKGNNDNSKNRKVKKQEDREETSKTKKKSKFAHLNGIAVKTDLFDDLTDEIPIVETDFGEIVFYKSVEGATVYNKNVKYGVDWFTIKNSKLSNAKLFPRNRTRYVEEDNPYVHFSYKTCYEVEAYTPVLFKHAHNRPVGCAAYVIKAMSGKEYSGIDLKTRLNLVDVLSNCDPGYHVWLRRGISSYTCFTTTSRKNVNKELIRNSKVLIIEAHADGTSHVWLGTKPTSPFTIDIKEGEEKLASVINFEPGIDLNRVAPASKSTHQHGTNNGFFGCSRAEWAEIDKEIRQAREALIINSNIEDLLARINNFPVLCAKYGLQLNKAWARLFFGHNPFPQFADNIQARMIIHKRLTSDWPSPFGYVSSWTDPNAHAEFKLPDGAPQDRTAVNGIWEHNGQKRVRTFLHFNESQHFNASFTQNDWDELVDECKAQWAAMGFCNSQREILLNMETIHSQAAFLWLGAINTWEWSLAHFHFTLPFRVSSLSPGLANGPIIHRGTQNHPRLKTSIVTINGIRRTIIDGSPGNVVAGRYDDSSYWRVNAARDWAQNMMNQPVIHPVDAFNEPEDTEALREVLADRDVHLGIQAGDIDLLHGNVDEQPVQPNAPANEPRVLEVRMPTVEQINQSFPNGQLPQELEISEMTVFDNISEIWGVIREEMVDGFNTEIVRFNALKDEIRDYCVATISKVESFLKKHSQKAGLRGSICKFLKRALKLFKNILSGQYTGVEAIYDFFKLVVRAFRSKEESEIPEITNCVHCIRQGTTYFDINVCAQCLYKVRPGDNDFTCAECGHVGFAWRGDDKCVACVGLGKYAAYIRTMPWCAYTVDLYMRLRTRFSNSSIFTEEQIRVYMSQLNPNGTLFPQEVLDRAAEAAQNNNNAHNATTEEANPPPTEEDAEEDEEDDDIDDPPELNTPETNEPVNRIDTPNRPDRPLPTPPVSRSSLPAPEVVVTTLPVNQELPEEAETVPRTRVTEFRDDDIKEEEFEDEEKWTMEDFERMIGTKSTDVDARIREEQDLAYAEALAIDQAKNATQQQEQLQAELPTPSNDNADFSMVPYVPNTPEQLRGVRLAHFSFKDTNDPYIVNMIRVPSPHPLFDEALEIIKGKTSPPAIDQAIVMPVRAVLPAFGLPPMMPAPLPPGEVEIVIPPRVEHPEGRWVIPHDRITVDYRLPPVGPPPAGRYTTANVIPGYSGWVRQCWDYGSSEIGNSTLFKQILWAFKEFMTDFDAGFYDAFRMGKHSMFWCYRIGNKYTVDFRGVDRRAVQFRNIQLRVRNPRFTCVEIIAAVGNNLNRGQTVNLRDLQYKRLLVCDEYVDALFPHARLNNVTSSADIEWLKSVEQSTTFGSINITPQEVIDSRQYFVIRAFQNLGMSSVNRLSNNNQPAR